MVDSSIILPQSKLIASDDKDNTLHECFILVRVCVRARAQSVCVQIDKQVVAQVIYRILHVTDQILKEVSRHGAQTLTHVTRRCSSLVKRR